ncbi:MAG: hypothetical protein KDE55_24735 [Novosphingobium sp.]|nr:hypothetical protein [Novosphingobium sp.]
MRRLTAALAAFLVTAPGVASAADTACLTKREFSSLAGYALPSLISGTTQRCAATLPAGSYLPKSGKQLATRYAASKASQWPGARAAFIKMSADKNKDANEIFTKMPDESLQQVVDAMLEGMIAQQIPTEQCDMIDNVVRLLAPLPPENTAELIGLLVGLGTKAKEGKVGSLRICPS